MNGRSGLFKFFLFLFLFVIIFLQLLSMVQSDRLYERLNLLLERLSSSGSARLYQQEHEAERDDLPMEKYPGDEGDWMVWRVHAEPKTLNPLHAEGSIVTNWIVLGSIFERLFEYDKEVDWVKLEPWLAEKMDISDDGLEVTVTLRDDIHFSDGVPLTADDVVFTYQTIMNPGVDAAEIRNYYDNFKDVVKINDRVVKFLLKEVYWKTIEAIGIFEVLPKHIYEFDDPQEFNKHISNPVGSGPYVFEKWDIGQQVVLMRNENYWGHKPKIKKIIYKMIANSTAALQALKAGYVDYMEPDGEQFKQMQLDEEFMKDHKALKVWSPGVFFFFIGWNQKNEFFQDRLVRLAMTHMIDRQSYIDYVLGGNAKMISGPFYIYGKQSNPDIEPWPYDPKKAKELLDQSGWVDSDGDGIRDKDGRAFRFKFSYRAGSTAGDQLSKLLKDEAAKLGVDVIPDPIESSILAERIYAREFDSIFMGWGGTVEGDYYQIFHSSQIEGRGSNFIGFSDSQSDHILEKARRILDETARNKLYHKFHEILHDEQPYTFLYMIPDLYLIDGRFENVIVHKLGIYPLEWYVPREKQKYK